jgi:hypothetical protein
MPAASGNAMFDRLKTLVGNWRGKDQHGNVELQRPRQERNRPVYVHPREMNKVRSFQYQVLSSGKEQCPPARGREEPGSGR